jgi:hypothetical protein
MCILPDSSDTATVSRFIFTEWPGPASARPPTRYRERAAASDQRRRMRTGVTAASLNASRAAWAAERPPMDGQPSDRYRADVSAGG